MLSKSTPWSNWPDVENPPVDFLADGLGLFVEGPYAFPGKDRCPQHLDAVHVGSLYEFPVRRDDLVPGDVLTRGASGDRGEADVVDPFEQDDPAYPRVGEDIAIEARESIGPRTVVQKAISGNTDVQNRPACGGFLAQQTLCEYCGPGSVGIRCRREAIGDGVTEGDDGGGLGWGEDVDTAQPEVGFVLTRPPRVVLVVVLPSVT